MGWTVADHHQQARRGDLLWSQEWGVGFRHANQPSTLLSFLGLQWDMTGSSAATSGSCSTLQRVDWAGDAFEAHNPYLRARDHVAVRQSPVSCRLHRQGWSVLERRIECVARPAFIFSSGNKARVGWKTRSPCSRSSGTTRCRPMRAVRSLRSSAIQLLEEHGSQLCA